MEDISLHIMDIVENSVTAGARNVLIGVRESRSEDILEVVVKDDGRGMDEEFVKRATDPFVTTKVKKKKVGLGLALLNEAAEAANGRMTVESRAGLGTTVKADFQLSHPDRKPLGDMKETLFCLMATFPEVDFTYEHRKEDRSCRISTSELRGKAGEALKSLPDWIRFLKERLEEEFDSFK